MIAAGGAGFERLPVLLQRPVVRGFATYVYQIDHIMSYALKVNIYKLV